MKTNHRALGTITTESFLAGTSRNRSRPTVSDMTLALCISILFGIPSLFFAYIGLRAAAEAPSQAASSAQMPSDFGREVARVVGENDRIEADTLRDMNRTARDREGQMHTLGKLLLFDKHLSVRQTKPAVSATRPRRVSQVPLRR